MAPSRRQNEIPAILEGLRDDVEHGCELTEDQGAVTAIDCFLEELEQGIELRGRGGALLAQQPQIAARLSQPKKGGQHAHASCAGGLLAKLIDLDARGDLKLRVGRFLFGTQFYLEDLLNFVRELGKNFLSCDAASDKGAGAGRADARAPRVPRLRAGFHSGL